MLILILGIICLIIALAIISYLLITAHKSNTTKSNVIQLDLVYMNRNRRNERRWFK
jgi:hypothetical protein